MKYKPTNGMISLFDNFFTDDFFNWNVPANNPAIDYDIVENDEKYVLDLMLPGFKKGDVSIDVDDNVLTIEGERNAQEETIYNRKGSFYGKFKKSFTLPDNVLADEINASFKLGILSLDIPKTKESKLCKTIEIK